MPLDAAAGVVCVFARSVSFTALAVAATSGAAVVVDALPPEQAARMAVEAPATMAIQVVVSGTRRAHRRWLRNMEDLCLAGIAVRADY